MKLTGLKWGALPAVVLMAGSVVLAQDQPAPSSEPAPPAQSATPGTPATPAARPPSAVRSAFERRQLNGQQSQLFRQMYKDNHYANAASYGNSKMGKRQENQQDRIAQRIKSGQLTAGETAKLENQQKGINQQDRIAQRIKSGQLKAGETAKLENQQKGINQQVKADRAANGGKLITGEKQQVYKQQNVASKSIYNKKPKAKTQPQAKPQQ
jgi:hypothetical protein